jgi:hypothetical protein
VTIEQVTESQRLLAQTMNALADAANKAVTMRISTTAALATVLVPASITAIEVLGGAAVGDGLQGVYVRGTGAGQVSSADGATWIPATRHLFATLPAANTANGLIAAITDGLAGNCGDGTCTTWGTTVTGGGGALKLLLWSNGTNWTLIGK